MNMLAKRRGALGVVFGVVTVVILGIVLILGALVFFAFSNSLPTGLVTGAQQSTLNSIVSTGASAISLLEVVLIVAAAGLIIAAVFAYMAISRRKLRAAEVRAAFGANPATELAIKVLGNELEQ